jgi:hypothetical protein
MADMTEEVTSANGNVTVPTGEYSPPRVDVVLKAAVQDILRITDGIAVTASTAIPRPAGGAESDVLTLEGGKPVWRTPVSSIAAGRPTVFASLGYNADVHHMRAQTSDRFASSYSMSGGTVTVTTSEAHGLTAGTWIELGTSYGWATHVRGLHKLISGTSGNTLKFTIEGSSETIGHTTVSSLRILAKWQKLPPVGTLTLDTTTDLMVNMPVHQVSCTTGTATGSAYIGVGYKKHGSPDHPTLGAYFIVGGNTPSVDYNGSGVSSYLLRAMPEGTYDLTCWAFTSTGTTAFFNGIRFQVMGWAASIGAFTGDETDHEGLAL